MAVAPQSIELPPHACRILIGDRTSSRVLKCQDTSFAVPEHHNHRLKRIAREHDGVARLALDAAAREHQEGGFIDGVSRVHGCYELCVLQVMIKCGLMELPDRCRTLQHRPVERHKMRIVSETPNVAVYS